MVAHSHNEPGHGADICDTAGANCIRECWRWTKRTGISIISAAKTCECLRKAKMDGFVHLQVTHDPDQKIVLPKGTGFDGVLISQCLTKEYPCYGRFAGGIVFKRCYDMGQGIGFTKEQCESMWDDINLDDHVQVVHTGAVTPAAPAVTPTPRAGTCHRQTHTHTHSTHIPMHPCTHLLQMSRLPSRRRLR